MFIGEDAEHGAMFTAWSGRFTAHWEGDGRVVQGPQGVSVEEAIGWGRKRSEVVLIRPGDENVYYSAGARRPDPDTPVWPAGRQVTRRRQAGFEHLDICAEQPIEWEVRMAPPVPDPVDEAAVRSALAVSPGAELIDGAIRFVVQARTHQEALRLVTAVKGELLAALPRPAGDENGVFVYETGFDPADHIRPLRRATDRG